MLKKINPIQFKVMFEENLMVEEDQTIEKHVKTFLDIVILSMLNGRPTYGYKIIAIIHKEFGILLSPASLYPLLHALENEKLIESSSDDGKTFYQLTPRGKETFRKKFSAYNLSTHIMCNFIKKGGPT